MAALGIGDSAKAAPARIQFNVEPQPYAEALLDIAQNPVFLPSLVVGLPGAPAVSGGATVSYERQVFGDWTLRLIGQATYVGRSRVTFDGAQPKMGGYARTRPSAEILGEAAGPPVGVQLFVNNPLDSFSDTFAFGNPFNPDQTRQITPQRPVTVEVTLSAEL